MTATYTFDVFSSLDGYGSHSGDWGGYWGKQGPELLAHRLPVVTGRSGAAPIFRNAPDLDLELIERRTLDGHIEELTYRPTLRG